MASSVPRKRQGFTSKSSALTFTSSWCKIHLRCCLLEGCAMSWGVPTRGKQEKTSKERQVKGPSRAAPTVSFLSPRSLSRKSLHLSSTKLTGETLWQIKEVEETVLNCWNLSLKKFDRRRRSIGQKITSSRKRSKRRPNCGNRTSFGCTRCRWRPSHYGQKYQRNCSKESERFKTKKRSQCVHAFSHKI